MAKAKTVDLSVHHETITFACAQLLKTLESRDPQQRVIAKSCIAVIEQIEANDNG